MQECGVKHERVEQHELAVVFENISIMDPYKMSIEKPLPDYESIQINIDRTCGYISKNIKIIELF